MPNRSIWPSTIIITAASCLAIACSNPSPKDAEQPAAAEKPTDKPADPGPAKAAMPTDDEVVARVTAFATAVTGAIADNEADCAKMGEALLAVADANKDMMALSANMLAQDPERKTRLRTQIQPITNEIIGPKIQAFKACDTDPKIRELLARLPR